MKNVSIWYCTLKLLKNLLMAVLLCGIIFFSFIFAIDMVIVKVIVQAVNLFILFVLIYAVMWKIGQKDSNAVQFGHMQPDRTRSFKIGFLASIPFFLFWLFTLVPAKIGLFSATAVYIYKFLTPQFVIFNQLIMPSLIPSELNWGSIIGVLALHLLIPAVAAFAYMMGYKGIMLKNAILYQNTKQDH